MAQGRDLFAEYGIKIDRPQEKERGRDLFALAGVKSPKKNPAIEPEQEPVKAAPVVKPKADTGLKMPEYPFLNRPQTKSERAQANKELGDVMKGAAQSYLNTPEEAANVFGGHLYNKFNFAPKNEIAKMGAMGGDIASYFMPSGLAKLGLKGLSYIPKAGKLIKGAEAGLSTRPITNFLLNTGRNTGEAALFQGEKNPQSSPLDIAQAGGWGGGMGIAANALTNTNPLIRLAAKLGTGGALGYHYNGLQGIPEGMAAGVLAPKLMQEAGIGNAPVSYEMLTQPENPLARAKYEAGQRLKDVRRPSEVFNSPGMGAQEGEIARTEAGGQAMTDFGAQGVEQQKNAINRLLRKVYPNTKRSNALIGTLYKHSYQKDLSQNALSQMAEDPVFTAAAEYVNKSPVYQKKLKNVRPTSLAYLDQVKRRLGEMEKSMETGSNEATIIGDTRRDLTEKMDAESKHYKAARELANRKIIRDQIEERLGKKPIKGKTFFNEFLANDNKFNDLLHDVRKNPEAQQMLKDMKVNWDNLIGYDTPATAAGMAGKHTSSAREGFQKFWNEYKNMIGAPRDLERAKFIHDPDWWSKFDEVMKYKNKLERNKRLGDLLAKGISGGVLEYSKETLPPDSH